MRVARPLGAPLGTVVAAVVVLVGVLVAGCGPSSTEPPARQPGPPRVVVTIAPLAGLVRGVAGPDAEITTLLPAGASPHGFELTPDDVRAMARADVIIAVGVGLEPWLERRLRSAPDLARRAASFADLVGIDAPIVHAHEGDGHPGHEGHNHGPVDPHLWLDPVLVESFVAALPAVLADRVAEGLPPDLTERAADLAARVRATHDAYTVRLAPFEGASIVANHAAFVRTCERYGLTLAGVLRPNDAAEPTPTELADAQRAIADAGAVAVFAEPQYDTTLAERLAAATGVPLGTLDPLGTGDWFEMMSANLDEFERVLSASERP
jgi:zinc transport system substrate-binding protein